MLIAFYGLPRSGKDTAADHLASSRQLHRASFGAGIYEEVSRSFCVPVDKLYSHEWKTEEQDGLALMYATNAAFQTAVMEAEGPLPHDDPEQDLASRLAFMSAPRTSRFILQRWATEFRRRQDPLYWVKKLDTKLKEEIAKHGLRDIVISDLRELHEYQYLHNLSSELITPLRVIEVQRAGVISNGHSSDNALPKWCIDERIVNSDIDEFRAKVEQVVKDFHQPKKVA